MVKLPDITPAWSDRLRKLLFAACLIAPGLMLRGAQSYVVNMPSWDSWIITGTPLMAALDGSLSFDHFWEQMVDNRMPVPRLIFVALALATKWNANVETLVTALFGLLALGALVITARATWPRQSWSTVLVSLFGSILLFSPTQWVIWTYPPLLSNMLLVAATIGIIALFASQLSPVWKCLAGSLLATICCLTYLAGWASWLLLFGLATLGIERRRMDRRYFIALGACVVLFGVLLFIYFKGYQLQGQPGLVSRVLHAPGQYLSFYLHWLGAPFADVWNQMSKDERLAHLHKWSLLPASCAVLLVVFCTVRILPDPESRFRAWPWFGLLGWAASVGGMLTLGRAELAGDAAFWPRYQLITCILWIALVALSAIAVRRGTRWERYSLLFVALSLSAGFVESAGPAWYDMKADSYISRNIKAGVLMMGAAPTAQLLSQSLPGDFATLSRYVPELDRHGFISPPLLKTSIVSKCKLTSSPQTLRGQMKKAKILADGTLVIEGWAVNTATKEPADAVAISIQTPGAPERWFGVSSKRSHQKLTEKKYRVRGYQTRLGWIYEPPKEDVRTACSLPAPTVPAGAVVVRAYAIDATTLTFTRLDGLYKCKGPAHTPLAR